MRAIKKNARGNDEAKNKQRRLRRKMAGNKRLLKGKEIQKKNIKLRR